MANAGADQTAAVGTTVILDGTRSSDRDGDPLTFVWRLIAAPAGSTATLTGAATPRLRLDRPGQYTVELVVYDGHQPSAQDVVLISTANSAPVADASPDQTAGVGTAVVLDGSRSGDVDGDPLTYAWRLAVMPPGSAEALDDPTSVSPQLVLDAPGAYIVELVVHDGTLPSAPDAVVISTLNTPPVAAAGPEQAAMVGTTITLDGSGSADVDGDPLAYAWSFVAVPPGSLAAFETSVAPRVTLDRPGT